MVLFPYNCIKACLAHENHREEQSNYPDMAYRTETLEDADFEYIVPRMFEAIGNDYEFINALYPSHQTQAGQSKIASRFIALKNAAPNGKWIKAVTVTSGEIVGLALWTVINQEKPPEAELDGPPGTWPNNEEKKYCQAMHRVLLADRRRVIRENSLPIMGECRSKAGTLEQYKHLHIQY
jgi:hypothetical protein